MTSSRLSVGEFAFPGPVRDRLVAAILSGAKTTTSSLLIGYQRDREPLPRRGDRWVVIDSAGQPVALIEVVEVRVIRLAGVDLAHAVGEGEGFGGVAEWRAGHEEFWHSDEARAELGDPAFTVNDDTQVVAEEFRLITDEHLDLQALLRQARRI
jgi:uncharacterized protein YhfF